MRRSVPTIHEGKPAQNVSLRSIAAENDFPFKSGKKNRLRKSENVFVGPDLWRLFNVGMAASWVARTPRCLLRNPRMSPRILLSLKDGMTRVRASEARHPAPLQRGAGMETVAAPFAYGGRTGT